MEHVLETDRVPAVLTFQASGRSRRVDEQPADVASGLGALAATIRAVAAGDQDAFAQLYADYVRMVHAIVLGRVPHRDVDDLVQDVFLTAYTRVAELRNPAAFGGWIAAIARNRATDHLRQSREQVELPEDLPGGDPIQAETFAVLEVVRKLPEAYRETLLMRLVEGMSGAEIAERSGLTPASVRVNLHRGMKLLRERLGGET
ncbi:MAG: sigma-70 family RNA polymerase sigma factor [Acidobacteria bacterium]|nr:MAG: sigma-70 family RNA polymerase sigma factor [Acidobacteriota bacterium]